MDRKGLVSKPSSTHLASLLPAVVDPDLLNLKAAQLDDRRRMRSSAILTVLWMVVVCREVIFAIPFLESGWSALSREVM